MCEREVGYSGIVMSLEKRGYVESQKKKMFATLSPFSVGMSHFH